MRRNAQISITKYRFPKYMLTSLVRLVSFSTNFLLLLKRMENTVLSCKLLGRALLCLALVFGVAVPTFASDDSSKAAPSGTPLLSSHAQPSAASPSLPVEYFVIETSHRVHANFRQVDTVGMNQKFAIGEGDEVGEVFIFNPDFAILDSGQVVQRSDSLFNPAVRIRVTVKDSVIQQNWAFFRGGAPHYRRNDLLGFRLVDFRVSDKFIKIEEPMYVPATKSDTSGHKK